MNSSGLAIETQGLTRDFNGRRSVDRVDLQVSSGGVFALLGTNGAGKTTTVRMLATLLRPSAGVARILGRDVVTESTAVRALIGLTGQFASVDEDLTAHENLVIFSRLVGHSRKLAKARADELLDEFALGEWASRRVGHFSGGMRRRLDLAASLITQPELLFLDEPTTGLDPRTRIQMWQTVRSMVANGSTVFLTTQYLDEADALADRIAVMDRGRLIAEGTPDDLKKMVGDATVRIALADARELLIGQMLCGPFVPGDVVGIDVRNSVLTVPMDDLDRLGQLLISLSTWGIRVTSVNVVRPTLDEVFFALTSGESRSSDADSAA